jgi:Alginate export
MRKVIFNIVGLLFTFFICLRVNAQLTASGQLRTRTEFRDGQGTLKPKDNSASFFTSQRTRLTVNYKMGHVVFHASAQDTRVWGQDASTISAGDGNRFELHEAWVEIGFADKNDSSFKHSAVGYFGVQIGRQELSYDDQRLLGGLDWLQQGRHHDAIVFKFLNKGWQVDLGAAFNQNTDAVNYNGTFYTPANILPYIKDSKGNLAPTPSGFIPLSNAAGWSSKTGTPVLETMSSTNGLYQDYKALTYLYTARTFNQTKISGLIVADYFGKYGNDSVRNIAGKDTGYIYGKHFNQKGVNTRVTGGLLLNSFPDAQKAFELTAGFYYQFGKDRDAQKLAAYTSTLSLSYTKSNFTYIAGWDYVSGNNSFSSSTINHRFDPLYGTPHKFHGGMDYFYVSTGSPTGGLNNPFAKAKYSSTGKRFSAELDYHYFRLAKDQKDTAGNAIKKYLGSEVDLVTTYSLNKIASIEYGFSVMAASRSMEYGKNSVPATTRLTGLWSYVMLTIKPDFLFK